MPSDSNKEELPLNDGPGVLTIGSATGSLDAIPGAITSVGRRGDLVIGPENPFMHRKLLTFHTEGSADDTWVISNVGRFISVTIVPSDEQFPVSLPPGDSTFVRWPEFILAFVAGDEEFYLDCYAPIADNPMDLPLSGTCTIGPDSLAPEARLILAALARPTLLSPNLDFSLVPKNRDVAKALGLTTKQFDHRLDALCKEFAASGVTGLIGATGQLASNRRIKIVQFAIESRLVSVADLEALP